MGFSGRKEEFSTIESLELMLQRCRPSRGGQNGMLKSVLYVNLIAPNTCQPQSSIDSSTTSLPSYFSKMSLTPPQAADIDPIDPNWVSPYADEPPPEFFARRMRRRGRDINQRLSMQPGTRTNLAFTSAFLVGGMLGFSHGSKTAALRFRAENAHRLPTSQKGWYFYHKSKSYEGVVGGVKEGVKMGLKTAIWVTGFITMEDAVDQWRGAGGQRDCFSSLMAGLTTAGLFSLWNRFPVATAARTARMGLKIGLGYGIVQDLFSLAQGRKVPYVEFGKRLFNGLRNGEEEAHSEG
jgi:hypothetical protein